MATCIDFLSYRCVGCKHFSRDLPENCTVCEFNTGGCVDCVSVTECAQRPNFGIAEHYKKMKENKCVYGLPYRFMRMKLYKVQAWQGLCYWGYVVRAVTPADAWLEVVLKTDCPVDAKHLVVEMGINEKT